MNSLEQIPEEKENMEVLTKVSKLAFNSQKNFAQNKILSPTNSNSLYPNKNQVNVNNRNVLAPTQLNAYIKPINKSKSQSQCFKSIRSMPQVAAPEPISIEDLEDQLETLILHQKQCQNESKYVEAEMAKQRVKELKVLLEKRTKEDIKSRHSREMNEIQKAYLDEIDQFNSFWDKKRYDYEENSIKIEKEQIQKQEVEMSSFINDLERSLDIRPKDSTEILNLRKVEAELAKNEDYMQAHIIKQKIALIEREEMDRYQFERQKRMKNLVQQLKVKHQTELQAVQKRIQAGKEEQVKLRSLEFERLLQKFMIAKKDLQQTQVNEANQYSKAVKLGSVILASKQVSQSQISNASFQKNLAIIKRPEI